MMREYRLRPASPQFSKSCVRSTSLLAIARHSRGRRRDSRVSRARGRAAAAREILNIRRYLNPYATPIELFRAR